MNTQKLSQSNDDSLIFNIFDDNTSLISTYKNFEVSTQTKDQTIEFLSKFFKFGVIKFHNINNNTLQIKLQLNHEQILFVNFDVVFNDNMMIEKINLYEKFFQSSLI
jgi:hypothetical protein